MKNARRSCVALLAASGLSAFSRRTSVVPIVSDFRFSARPRAGRAPETTQNDAPRRVRTWQGAFFRTRNAWGVPLPYKTNPKVWRGYAACAHACGDPSIACSVKNWSSNTPPSLILVRHRGGHPLRGAALPLSAAFQPTGRHGERSQGCAVTVVARFNAPLRQRAPVAAFGGGQAGALQQVPGPRGRAPERFNASLGEIYSTCGSFSATARLCGRVVMAAGRCWRNSASPSGRGHAWGEPLTGPSGGPARSRARRPWRARGPAFHATPVWPLRAPRAPQAGAAQCRRTQGL